MSLKNPSILAFERKICCSDGLMYAGSWTERHFSKNWQKIPLQNKDIRGTISSRETQLEKKESANLQSIDIASLPFDTDTLKLSFTVKILGNLALPSVCNDQMYQEALSQKIGTYIHETHCHELAIRYAENFANGRFFWRNRIGAEELEIKVSLIEKNAEIGKWIFNGYQYSLQKFSGFNDSQIKQLAETIQRGLQGNSFVLLKVEAFARIGQGQEVFPSQEFIRDSSGDEYKKMKVLYAVDGTAALHSQKIGNALRTIDTWYTDEEEAFPIAVEPYGAVTTRGKAYRPSKNDFYTLLDNWILKDRLSTLNDQHYVVSCLIRGGVFGEKGEKKGEKKEEKKRENKGENK